jgi:hypothetical protein
MAYGTGNFYNYHIISSELLRNLVIAELNPNSIHRQHPGGFSHENPLENRTTGSILAYFLTGISQNSSVGRATDL